MAEQPASWTDEEVEDLLTDAISYSAELDWTARDGAKAIMRELSKCGLHVTYTPARLDLLSNPPHLSRTAR